MKNKWIFVLLLALVLFDASSAFAAMGGSGSLPYEGWLSTVVSSISGPVAYGISLLGIIGAGAALALGGQEMSQFIKSLLYLVLVMALVIGAKEILSNVMGMSALIIIGG